MPFMRGETVTANGMDVRRAALLLDLHAAGVRAEMGDAPYPWFAADVKPAPKAAAAPLGGGAALAVAAKVAGRSQPVELVREGARIAPLLPRGEQAGAAPAPAAAPVAEGVSGQVWSEGDAGGVVVVVQGSAPPAGAALELLRRMLAAVGLDGDVAWVGVDGRVEGSVLAAKIEQMQARKVLLLGQGVLGILAGRSLGVEGWQAAGGASLAGCGACAGVTYPPELLLAQPLFKRLAWQHLLAWKERWA